MRKIERIAKSLSIPPEEITKSERIAIKKATSGIEVCRILQVDACNAPYVERAMRKPTYAYVY